MSALRSQVLQVGLALARDSRKSESSTIAPAVPASQGPTVINCWAPAPLRFPGNGALDAIHVAPGKNGPEASKPVAFLIFTPLGAKPSSQGVIEGPRFFSAWGFAQ